MACRSMTLVFASSRIVGSTRVYVSDAKWLATSCKLGQCAYQTTRQAAREAWL